jgi:hypothetical protein
MALIWRRYTALLAARPILTKVFTAGKIMHGFGTPVLSTNSRQKINYFFGPTGSLMFVGDFIAQKLDKKAFDIKRSAILTSYASAMTPGM